MRLRKTVVINKPRDAVFDYLSDFTTTTEWDPGTVVTVNHHGDGGVGTTYLNTSTFLGRKTQLTTSCASSSPVSASGSAEKTRRSSPSTP